MWEIMARNAFVESLGDPALRLRILEKDPTTLEETLKMASRLEALGYGEQDNDWDDVGRRRDRYIKTTVAGEQSDQKCQQASTVKDLKEKLAKKDDQERQVDQRDQRPEEGNGGKPSGAGAVAERSDQSAAWFGVCSWDARCSWIC